MEPSIAEIVITGGPCSGKSEALKLIPKRLKEKGYNVVVLKEAAEEVFSSVLPASGDDIREFGKKHPEKFYAIEEQIFLEIMAKRKIRRKLANMLAGEKTVILLDRGPMDGLAYMKGAKERFFRFVRNNGYSVYDARDSFDGVVHLVSAADGAHNFYRQSEIRVENPRQARVLDKDTQWAWVGAPHLRIIDNSTGFDEKMDQLFFAILRILGDPEPLEIERKFLLGGPPSFRNFTLRDAEPLFIEQLYLRKDASGARKRIRRRSSLRYGDGRSQGDSTAYYLTGKTEISSGIWREEEGVIAGAVYGQLKSLKDSGTRTIRKLRYCFVYKNQYFELDEFIAPQWARGLWVLEIELLNRDDPVALPLFLDIAKEVTDERAYHSYYIAKKK